MNNIRSNQVIKSNSIQNFEEIIKIRTKLKWIMQY